MSINIGPPSVEELRPRITVIGVGGAGGNAIANMIEAQIEGVDFIVANTDAQALNNSIAEHRIQLGPDITQGLGAGSRPEVGRAAAEETVEEIERALDGVNMVFIAAGMGGGTGTGAAPVIAEIARRKGILTVGVVTKPFLFEGTRRMRAAEAGIEELQKHVDTLIVIPNQNLFLVAKADTTFKEAFVMADEVLQQGVRSITDLIVNPGMINLDFADIRSVMNEMGKAMMGTGEAEGPNRALEAAERAIANPLLDGVSMQGAKGVIISIIGGDDMKLLEIDEAANHIRELVDPEANIIWGTAFNPDMAGRIRVSVVATGIEQNADRAPSASPPIGLGGARGPRAPGLAVSPAPVPETATFATAGSVLEADRQGKDDGFTPDQTSIGQEQPPLTPEAATDELLDLADALEAESIDDAVLDAGEGEHDAESGAGGFGSLMGARRQDFASDWDEPAEANGAQEARELGANAEGAPGARPSQDELMLDAARLAPGETADSGILRRRRFFGSDEGDGSEGEGRAGRGAGGTYGSGSPSGSTLFERMASLSRSGVPSSAEDDPDHDDDTGSNFRVPRFLNRTNNQ